MATPPAPTPAFLATHLLGCSMLWASGFLFIKLAGAVDPFVIAAMRGLLGATSLAAFFLVQGKSLAPRGREWRDWLFLGTFNGWGPNILVAYAMTQITAASGAMIQAAAPLIVAVLAHAVFPEERLSGRRLLGILVGFAGMGLLIGPAALPESGVSAAGALAMVATAVSYAVGNVYARAVENADPARLALGQQICSALPATALALALAGPGAFAAVREHTASLVGLGVFATAIPILLFMRLIHGAGPTRAAMVGYLMPVWTAVLAILFLGERVGLREIAGGAVVLTGVAIVSFSGRLRRAR
ncbi:MAG TPA: DMT family transporter [Microvirga sp.]|nr:DMT family transporter [Microvirga sp.]